MSEETLPEYVKKPVLILGVGNLLFGDDGFGPAVVDYMLRNCKIPDEVYVMDVGIGAGDVLFTVGLSPKKPKKIIVLDAVDVKRKPGEIFELSLDDLPANKITDFSMHLFPAANLLKELRDQMGIDIVILACQAERIPDDVNPGLSDSVKEALLRAAEKALELAQTTRSERKTD
ncbi:MAG TPA: hydrogenase maturation protease [Candidatus Bathyarchaeia archaeon]|nr:hydrogenase maturation protease [Candidatus Bathyarchaeia archaeon]